MNRATGIYACTGFTPVGNCGSGNLRCGTADAAGGAVAKAKAAARQTDLAQHGGKGNGHPVRLFAVIGALHRPAHGDHGTHGGHAPRQSANRRRRDLRDGGGPGRVLGRAVGLPHDIGAQAFEADGVGLEKRPVVQIFGDQRMGQAQHQRHIGIGTQG